MKEDRLTFRDFAEIMVFIVVTGSLILAMIYSFLFIAFGEFKPWTFVFFGSTIGFMVWLYLILGVYYQKRIAKKKIVIRPSQEGEEEE